MYESLEIRRLLAVELISIIDTATSNSTSPTLGTITFYDVTDIRNAGGDPFQTTPLFSIWTGYEATNPAGTQNDKNHEELQSFAVDSTGRIGYALAFDDGAAGDVAFGDTNGDYDLYRFNVGAAYDDFIANNRPRGIVYAPRYSPDFNEADPENNTGIDFVAAYGGRPLGPTGLPSVTTLDTGVLALRSNPATVIRDNTDAVGSNDIIFLDGITDKVAEVARRQTVASNFFNAQDIQVVDANTIVFLENSVDLRTSTTSPVANDYSIRTIERISTSPGAATIKPGETGGYNSLTAESWESFAWSGANYVNMDNNPGTGNISDVDGMRFVSRDGVKGVWVSDDDGDGDDMTFFKLDFSSTPGGVDGRVATKVEQRVGASPFFTAFALDDDPEVSTTTNNGNLDGFDVDANGNLVIRESGFFNSPQAEPKIIQRAVNNFNAGDSDGNSIVEMTFGAWNTTANLVTSTDDDTAVTDARFGVYSAAQNIVYFIDLDSGGNRPDVYAFDLATETIIYSKLDMASPFISDGNSLRAFTLQTVVDTTAPTVTQAYAFLTEQSVTFTFSEPLATAGAGAFSAADITLTNTTTSTVIPTADLTLVDLGGNVYKLTYKTGAATTPLPKGVYTVVLGAAGITDVAGNALTPPTTLSFKVNPGDTDQDGDVDFDDLLKLAQNYGTTGKNYAFGNVNYDAGGAVDFDDLLLLAQNYGTTLNVAPRAITTLAGSKRRGSVRGDVLA